MRLNAEGLDPGAPFKAITIPDWKSLNERLRDVLLTMSDLVPDKGSHMPSGRSFFESKWLSSNCLHRDGDPVFRVLGSTIEDAANSLPWRFEDTPPLRIATMWSIISRSGMEGRRHDHKGAISAAYYVDAGTSSECAGGQLQFYAEATKPSPTHAVTPRDGLLILFPSRLHHSVSRYSSDYPRIVISANLQ